MIQRLFKKCGISNAIVGTEDDLFWEDDKHDDNTDADEDDENDLYDTNITSREFHELFVDSDEDDEGGDEELMRFRD